MRDSGSRSVNTRASEPRASGNRPRVGPALWPDLSLVQGLSLALGLGGLLIFLLSNFSPSLSLTFLGFVSRPLPLVVWMALATVAGSITAVVWQGLFQGASQGAVQVIRPRSQPSPLRSDAAETRRGRTGGSWVRDAQFVEPWDEDEAVLDNWVNGGTPSPSPASEARSSARSSPWQRVVEATAAVVTPGGTSGESSPKARSQPTPNPAPPRTQNNPSQGSTPSDTGNPEDWDDWGDRPNPDNDWADLDREGSASGAPPSVNAANADSLTTDDPDRTPGSTGATEQREDPKVQAPRQASRQASRQAPSQTSSQSSDPTAGSDRPRADRPPADRSSGRSYEAPQPPPTVQRSGSGYSYRYTSSRRGRTQAAEPAPPAAARDRPPSPPAYLNNPQAGQPDAIYDVDYRVIIPPQDSAPPAPEGGNRDRRPPTPDSPGRSSRPPNDDWDWDGSQNW